MKTAIKLLKELNEVRKEYPGFYDASKVDDCILVAAIVELAENLEDFKKSRPIASSDHEEIPENCLTLPSLQKQLNRSLVGTTLDEHHERALKIYKLLKSL